MENIQLLIPKNLNMLDLLQMLIIFITLYSITKTLRGTRAWILVKGIIIIAIFYVICVASNMVIIKYLLENLFGILTIAIVIMFQPELQKFVEKIGKNNLKNIFKIFKKENLSNQYFSDKTIDEISIACEEMSKVKTGALIVLERDIPLEIDSGIKINAEISSQLLINTFEKNTPLHDGAVIIKNDKLAAATCYLPLSENKNIKKSLGTRHRAGIGISEKTDCVVVIVSEETGYISVSINGDIKEKLSKSDLQNLLKTESIIKTLKDTPNIKKHETSFLFKSTVLIASIFISIFILNIEDPIETKNFTNVPVNIINGNILQEANKTFEIIQGETVSVSVTGHRSDLEGVTKNNIKATADFKEMSIVQAVPIRLNNSDEHLSYKILSNDVMILELEDLIQAEYPVTVKTSGQVKNGYYLYSTEAEPSIVLIEGTKTLLNKIGDVEATINISNIEQDTTFGALIKVYDKNGEEITDKLVLNKSTVNIKTTVYNSKMVPLKVKFMDENFETEENEILICAEEEILSKTNEIEVVLENIDKNKTEIIINLDLYLPENIYIPNSQSNTVAIKYKQVEKE